MIRLLQLFRHIYVILCYLLCDVQCVCVYVCVCMCVCMCVCVRVNFLFFFYQKWWIKLNIKLAGVWGRGIAPPQKFFRFWVWKWRLLVHSGRFPRGEGGMPPLLDPPVHSVSRGPSAVTASCSQYHHFTLSRGGLSTCIKDLIDWMNELALLGWTVIGDSFKACIRFILCCADCRRGYSTSNVFYRIYINLN